MLPIYTFNCSALGGLRNNLLGDCYLLYEVFSQIPSLTKLLGSRHYLDFTDVETAVAAEKPNVTEPVYP